MFVPTHSFTLTHTHTQVAIVGKGLTFDSGGYNLKAGPGSMIELMKVSHNAYEVVGRVVRHVF